MFNRARARRIVLDMLTCDTSQTAENLIFVLLHLDVEGSDDWWANEIDALCRGQLLGGLSRERLAKTLLPK